ncbi:hypothetical protein JT358_04010 [Micrococcales bacterium 31B]|nr:hypothetical protein [Micrococcales bacterium 31B]
MSAPERPDEQLSLIDVETVRPRDPREEARASATPKRRAKQATPPEPLAENEPVAQVIIASLVPHLDRVYDYAVPASMSRALPGTRVVVPFSGRSVDGFVVGRSASSEFGGSLQRLQRLVSPEVVAHPQILALARDLADRNASGVYEVLRQAIPGRHARAESRASDPEVAPRLAGDAALRRAALRAWAPYRGGVALCQRLANGESPRAAWSALPGFVTALPEYVLEAAGGAEAAAGDLFEAAADERAAAESDLVHWALAVAVAAAHTLASGRGVLVIVPEAKVLRQVEGIFAEALGAECCVSLEGEAAPEARYREFLRVSRGCARVALGTRSAIYAPVARLGLIAVWDDADENLTERLAPYAEVRDVAALRAQRENSALLYGGFARSLEVAHAVETQYLVAVGADREVIRRETPRVSALDDVVRQRNGVQTRVPQHAIRLVREALQTGPVLVQVPRGGFEPALRCAECGARGTCTACHGPLQHDAQGHLACRWCARPGTDFVCRECEGTVLRAAVVGVERTAQEIERMFPAARVKRSDAGGRVLGTVSGEPALVVATPGAEPYAEGGYAAALLLDGWSFLSRQELGAELAAVRRWLGAAALVRPARAGGQVILAADADEAPVQAVVRWAPEWFAEQQLRERETFSLPPFARLATVTGERESTEAFMRTVSLPDAAVALGPVEVAAPASPGAVRPATLQQFVLRVPAAESVALARALRLALRGQSALSGGLRTTQSRAAFSRGGFSSGGFSSGGFSRGGASRGDLRGAGYASTPTRVTGGGAEAGSRGVVQVRLDPPDLGA